MNRVFRAAIVMAAILSLALAGSVSAHTATPTCETITLAKAPAQSQADVSVSVPGHNGTVVLNSVPGNGVYAIAPGTYDVLWSDGFHVYGKVVEACATPTPEVTPTPTPEPTPVVTPTPTPDPTTEPTPVVTPEPTPGLTQPPTDMTETEQGQVNGVAMILAGLFLIIISVLMLSHPQPRR